MSLEKKLTKRAVEITKQVKAAEEEVMLLGLKLAVAQREVVELVEAYERELARRDSWRKKGKKLLKLVEVGEDWETQKK